MTKKDKIINRIVDAINTTAPDSEIYLYGSRARGIFNKTSDWDIQILLNTNFISFDYETKIMDAFYDIELETGEVFSPLVYSKNDWINLYTATPLFENIEKDGVRLK